MKSLIINLAPTGMVAAKAQNPNLPVTPAEIVADVTACCALGVSMVHLHARDGQGTPCHDNAVYGKIIQGIRESNPEVVIVATTSGRVSPDFEERAAPLGLVGGAKPDMASLTLSSMNFSSSASMNSPDTVIRLAERMREKGIKPELEVFDLGMVNYAHYLIRKGVLEPPYYFNILLGNIATAQARLLPLGLIVSELPENSLWSAAGIGDAQRVMTSLGVVMGDGVRIGLEDNLWLDEERNELASNQRLVERIVNIAQAVGRPVAGPSEVRRRLGLPLAQHP